MSEHVDKDGCFLTALSLVVAVLIIYMVIDMWADKHAEHHIRNLQRRVGELEQRK